MKLKHDLSTPFAGLMPKSFRDAVQKFLPHGAEDDEKAHRTGRVMSFEELKARLIIPVNDNPREEIECAELRTRGQFLARQDLWEDLGEEVRTSDRMRAITRSGQPKAELLLQGARSDAVSAAEHALLHGSPARDSRFMAGIEALEAMMDEHPEDYGLALMVANTHIDIGWAWRGTGAEDSVAVVNREAFVAHFARAGDILDKFCDQEFDSPALTAARCALLPGLDKAAERVADDFEDLIDFDPRNPRPMRQLGTYMLPRWYGDFQRLELEARRTAARLGDLWGAGGYAWVWFDALLLDPRGYSHIDMDYFLDGMTDILDRKESQHFANLVAAQLYHGWQRVRQPCPEFGMRVGIARALRNHFEDVVQNNLREVHPMIWGHASLGFESVPAGISGERILRRGRESALRAISLPFLTGLKDGQTVSFTPEGITILGS
ncbi:hypothetical protein SAMN04490248_10436 [Salinihabitans flavidus]|uniref:Uncharacterized protein n=1 Tax=Salinihabitans flavidus TaxID=569882 RepID=A0A1H8NX69_9RHOB|nr:hypothetical protein [Salinihabitans flavidus]SEO33953.1 hypothetical protein SAMN04490248_10436 [Salinihabitans flavidus]